MTTSWLTAAQICKRLGISDESWRRWRKAGIAPDPIPGLPPRHPRWTVQAIEHFERHGRTPKVRYFGRRSA